MPRSDLVTQLYKLIDALSEAHEDLQDEFRLRLLELVEREENREDIEDIEEEMN